MLRFRSPIRLVRLLIICLSATLLAPVSVSAWPGTPVVSAPGGCAATPFTHTLPPPIARNANGGKARDWISGDGIMIGLRMDYLGEWIEGTNNVFLWSGGNVEARITGRRLNTSDAAAVTLGSAAIGANTVTWNILTFPTPGCWSTTIDVRQIGSRDFRPGLQFVAHVMPEDQHAGKAEAIARRKANLPGSVPASCPVSPWDGPRRTGQGADYEFYIDGNGISLRSPDTVYAAGENELQWLTSSEREPTLTGVRLDAPGTIENVIPYYVIEGDGYPPYWKTVLTFPHAGCWQLTTTSGEDRLTATIYVFPKRRAGQ